MNSTDWRSPGVVLACGSIILMLSLGIRQSFGQFIMLPYGQLLISQLGWLNALLVLAASSFLIVPLASALAGRNAAAPSSNQSMREALQEAAAHRGFWYLMASFLVCGFQTLFIMVHLPAYLLDQGMTPLEGMTALALIGFFNIAGSYLCGVLGGWYGGYMYDLSGSYLTVWMVAAGLSVLAAVLCLPIDERELATLPVKRPAV